MEGGTLGTQRQDRWSRTFAYHDTLRVKPAPERPVAVVVVDRIAMGLWLPMVIGRTASTVAKSGSVTVMVLSGITVAETTLVTYVAD